MSSKGVLADCHTLSLRIRLADVDAFDLVGSLIILKTVSILANFSFMIFHILTHIKHRRSCSIGASSSPIFAAEVSIQTQIKTADNKNLAKDNAAVQASRRCIVHAEDLNLSKRFFISLSSVADSVKLYDEGQDGVDSVPRGH